MKTFEEIANESWKITAKDFEKAKETVEDSGFGIPEKAQIISGMLVSNAIAKFSLITKDYIDLAIPRKNRILELSMKAAKIAMEQLEEELEAMKEEE